MFASGVTSRVACVTGSTTNRWRFSSPVSSLRNIRKRPSADQSCQLMGRPLVRVTGSPTLMSPAGAIQTLSTPSTGASHEIQRPSGEIFGPKNVGLSNNVRRGMSERAVPIKWDPLWQLVDQNAPLEARCNVPTVLYFKATLRLVPDRERQKFMSAPTSAIGVLS